MHGIVLTPTFQRQAERVGLSDDEIFEMASLIAADPLAGDLMAGTGGARKLRHAGRGFGKSGGYRTIHYFGGKDVQVFLLYVFRFLLAVYGKGDKANISPTERNQLAALLPKIAAAYKSRISL